MAAKSETVFRKRVDKDLKKLPHSYWMSIQQEAICGDPDKIGCVNGRMVALELKSEEGKPSVLQEYKLSKIRNAGGFAYVVYPSNWPIVLAHLELLARRII